MCFVFLCLITFPYGVLGQVWYLIVSVPDCYLPLYFNSDTYLELGISKRKIEEIDTGTHFSHDDGLE